MKTDLVNDKTCILDKEALSLIYGGAKIGHFIYKEGRLVWVEN
jgi:hypothetical protein